MEKREKSIPNLNEVLGSDTTKEEFEQIAEGLITDKDKELFGKGARSKVVNSILYLAPLRPEPVTFDDWAYRDQVGFDNDGAPLKDEEVSRLLEIAKQIGVIKDAPNGRFMVDKKVSPKLYQILSQYD